MTYTHGDTIQATFNPKTPVRPEWEAFKGKRLTLNYLWYAEDNEKFAGQPVFTESGMPDDRITPGHWIPLEDLDDIVKVA